ncbi:MAG: flavin reductase family protein [Chloroflexota bacterium]|nr:flavin reductase family protein [Chloroflexota bacterium]
MPIEREQFFRLMASFASGVTVVTSHEADGNPRGFTASAFTSLSLEPRLCVVCVDNRSESLPAIQATRMFAVNILAEPQRHLSTLFASKAPDKFAKVRYRRGEATGAPIIDGALAYIECRVQEMLPGGDHTILVGEVLGGEANEGAPLLYFRGQYRRLG